MVHMVHMCSKGLHIAAYLADIVISDQDIPSSQVTMYEALLG